MLEKIIDDKIRSKGYSELEIARCIYIELGYILSFNADYKNNFIKSQYFDIVDIKKFNQNKIICRIWSQLYCSLLKKYNIKAKINANGHAFVDFYINNELWTSDATCGQYSDLSRIKHGDYTVNFGKCLKNSNTFTLCDDPKINKEETRIILDKVDKKIGYYDKIEKLNRLKNNLLKIKNGEINIFEHSDLSNNQLIIVKLDYLFNKLGNMCNGIYEANSFLQEIYPYILSDEEIKLVKGTQLIRINKKNHTDIIQCISVKTLNDYVYYLLAPNYFIKKVGFDDIINLTILGYGIGDNNIPGIDYPKKFIDSTKSKQGNIFRKFIVFKNCPYLKIYNEHQYKNKL